MSPLVLASELAWGDEASPRSAGDDAGGLSPVALRPLSRMSEEEKQVRRFRRTSTDPMASLLFHQKPKGACSF